MAEAEADAPPDLAERAALPEEAELAEHHRWLWEAFQAIQHDRQHGDFGGVMPLGFAPVDRYARRYGIDGDDFDLLLFCMREMDAVYVELVNRDAAERAEMERRKNR